MTNPDDKDKARLKRQRNLVAKYNKYKPKALKKKTEYNRQSNKNKQDIQASILFNTLSFTEIDIP